MSKKNFYGVYGRNGGGVYDSWNKVMRSRPFIKGGKEKGFRSQKDAVGFVVQGLVSDYGVCQQNEIFVPLLADNINRFNRLEDLLLSNSLLPSDSLPFSVQM